MELNEGKVSFIDAEFDTTSIEKIDFGLILMNQINYVRFLMSQDMGQFALFDLNAYNSDKQKETFWFGNLAKFINSVESFKSLMITYQNPKFKIKIKKLNLDFQESFKKKKNEIKTDKNREDKIIALNVLYNLKNKVKLYSLIFEECLMLAKQAHFIGGDDHLTDTA